MSSRKRFLIFTLNIICSIPHIHLQIALFMESLRESSKVNEPVNLHRGFRALTMDTITAYCYGNSFGALSTPDFKHPILISLGPATPIATASRHFPILHLFKRLPYWFAQAINRDMIGVVQLHRFVLAQIDGILHNPDSLRSAEHETIYHHLLPETAKRTDWPSRKSLHEEVSIFPQLRGYVELDRRTGAQSSFRWHRHHRERHRNRRVAYLFRRTGKEETLGGADRCIPGEGNTGSVRGR